MEFEAISGITIKYYIYTIIKFTQQQNQHLYYL